MSGAAKGAAGAVVFALLLVGWGCADDATDPAPMTGNNAGDPDVGEPVDTGDGEDAGPGQDAADVAVDVAPDLPEGCPPPRTCGELCCEADQECVGGACEAACPTQRCGASGACCTGGEVCHFDQCRPPGEVCRVKEDCEGDAICLDGYCYEAAGPCTSRDDCPPRHQCDGLTQQCFRPPPTCLSNETECGNLCCPSWSRCDRSNREPSCIDDPCEDDRDRCGGQCCAGSRECFDNSCVPICQTERCGPLGECCPGGEVCREGSCEPACPAVSCGDECCGQGEICFIDRCLLPGGACMGSFDCGEQEYCDPGLERCLPVVDVGTDCLFTPEGNFNPTVEWGWESSATMPEHVQVMMAPMVAQTTDDNGDGLIDERDIPDVIINSYRENNYTSDGVLRILSGADGRELHVLDDPSMRTIGASSVAVADIDGDALPEVVTGRADPGGQGYGVVVFELHSDGLRWVKKWEDFSIDPRWGGAALADFDGDGLGEVVVGNMIFDHDGTVLATAEGVGTGDNGVGPLSIVADVDLDQVPEVVTGGGIFEADGTVTVNWGGDGFVAIGDFLGTPEPQVVVVHAGMVTLRRSTNGQIVWQRSVPGPASFNRVGPPTVADFDGDGLPEVAVAGGGFYVILDTDGQVLWQVPTQDLSSNVTGSSVFDFDGDDVAEVVYNDECFIRVFDIRYEPDDPASVRFQLPNTSCTAYEYPVVADVDNDGNAELITVRSDPSTSVDCGLIRSRCAENWPDFDFAGAGAGVRVFGDANDQWVPTRRIWNQHSYHITNIDEAGRLPVRETPSWTAFNSYRKNDQGDGIFNAPDLSSTNVEVDNEACPASVTLRVRVLNQGTLGIREGLPVSFYRRQDEDWVHIGTATTTSPLIAGTTEEVTFVWEVPEALRNGVFDFRVVVDDRDGEGRGVHSECREENNEAVVEGVDCREPS